MRFVFLMASTKMAGWLTITNCSRIKVGHKYRQKVGKIAKLAKSHQNGKKRQLVPGVSEKLITFDPFYVTRGVCVCFFVSVFTSCESGFIAPLRAIWQHKDLCSSILMLISNFNFYHLYNEQSFHNMEAYVRCILAQTFYGSFHEKSVKSGEEFRFRDLEIWSTSENHK